MEKEKPFFNDLIEYMTSEPVIVQVLSGENCVEKYRSVMGATNPDNADEGTIRKLFALNIQENSVHGSDSEDNAKIPLPKAEINTCSALIFNSSPITLFSVISAALPPSIVW